MYSNEYFQYRDGLLNTYAKLTQDEQLTVAYMGGSVTYGIGASDLSDSYRSRTTAWLKSQFPNATITEVNAAVPSACSAFGAYWVDEIVLPRVPDLVFVEYAINDYYARDKYSLTDVSRHYETIIRKLRRANPACDIVALYTTDNTCSMLNTPYFEQAETQDGIAAMYGIPSINVGYQSCKELSLTSGINSAGWYTYYTDGVHPTEEGYAQYAKVITRCLQTALIEAPKFFMNISATPKNMPASKNSDLIMNSRYIPAVSMNATGWALNSTGVGVGGFGHTPGYLYTNSSDAAVTFSVTGKDIALFCTLGGRSITYTIDGGEEIAISTNNHPMPLGLELSDEEHTIAVRCNDATADSPFVIAGVLTV